jgi:hypothetical protein
LERVGIIILVRNKGKSKRKLDVSDVTVVDSPPFPLSKKELLTGED